MINYCKLKILKKKREIKRVEISFLTNFFR